MRKYNLINAHLTEGQRITLVYQGSFGGMSMAHTTYLSCAPAPHYQNCGDAKMGVSIRHKPWKKRSEKATTISFNTPLVVYDGWQEIDIDGLMYNQIDETLRESKYDMFDRRYFYDLLASYPDSVIFADID